MKPLISSLLILIFLNIFSCKRPELGAFSGILKNGDTMLTENIFPFQTRHCHASTIVELPNHDLLVAWFQGSGERTAEDVAIKGARYNHKSGKWSEPFIMADTEGFPDINPVLFIDGLSRLWLVWYTVMAYQWESSLIKYRISSNFMQKEGPPVWSWQDVLHVKADGSATDGINSRDTFVKTLERKYSDYYDYLVSAGYISKNGEGPVTDETWNGALQRYMDIAKGMNFMADGIEINEKGEKIRTRLGYPLMRRIGWQTRNKPLFVNNRILLPLYSDGFDFSLIAISDNNGNSWRFSEPVVGAGSIQPALALCRNGEITAYMRDNGPPPHRIMVSISADTGKTWSTVKDTGIPNPGSAADMIVLKSGNWVLVSNDLEEGRHRLAVKLSADEGKTWPYSRNLVDGAPGSQTRAHYPAIIQDANGFIHVTFTNQVPSEDGKSNVKNIAHAVFTEKWLMKE
ncbi:MAG TPA: exo-alpha-sialidase [Bacteroidales bacterium]|nr:exo-alpha-sialidase [Bacteroidales bacterium]